MDEKEPTLQLYPPSNDTKEQLEDSDNASRKFSHNQEEKSAQDDASGDQDIQVYEESEPELPERGHLEYILLRLNLT